MPHAQWPFNSILNTPWVGSQPYMYGHRKIESKVQYHVLGDEKYSSLHPILNFCLESKFILKTKALTFIAASFFYKKCI
jgi:hypothetical protein